MKINAIIIAFILFLAAVFTVTVFKYVNFLEKQNQFLLTNINRDMSKLLTKIDSLESGNSIIELYSQNSLLKADNAALEQRIKKLESGLSVPAAQQKEEVKAQGGKEKKEKKQRKDAGGNKGVLN